MNNLEVYKPRDISKVEVVGEKRKYSFGKYLSREDINNLLGLIPHDRPKHMMFFQFLWRTGCRVTEGISIKKEQLNFQDGYMEIRWLKNRKYHRRIIPMHSSLKNGLQVYCAALKAEERLFPWTRQRADQIAKKYCFGHCHALRHSYAVNFLRQSKGAWDLVILQKLMGHSNIRSTMKYLDAVPSDQKAAIEEVKFD